MKRRALKWSLAALGALLLIAGGALWWFIASESALQWSLARLQNMLGEKLQLEGARGSLWQGIAAERVLYEDEKIRIEIHGLYAQAALGEGLRGHLYFHALRADKALVWMKPQPEEPLTLPESLRLPLDLSIPRAELKLLEIERDAMQMRFSNLVLQYAGTRGLHRIDALQAQSDYGSLGFAAHIGTAPPFNLSAQLRWLQSSPRPGQGLLNASGSLAKLKAAMQAQVGEAQLNAQSFLQPFDALLIESLKATVTDVDLRALDADLPQSKLSVTIDATSSTKEALSGRFEAANALPGPLDLHKLPLRRVAGAFLTDFKNAELSALEIDLGAGGRLSGKAEGNLQQGGLQMQVRALNLRGFYSSLRETGLNGPIELNYTPAEQSATAKLNQNDMQFDIAATRRDTRIDLSHFEARARGGSLNARGHIELNEARAFEAELKLSRFDPAQFGAYPQGLVNGAGHIEGALNPRRAQARWEIANSHLDGLPLFSDGRFQLIGEHLNEVAISARWGDANLQAKGAVGRATDELAWQVLVPQLRQFDDAYGGRIEAQGKLAGTMPEARLQFELGASALRLPGDFAASSVTANGLVSRHSTGPLQMEVRVKEFSKGNLRLTALELLSQGTLDSHRLQLRADGQDLALNTALSGAWQSENGWIGRIDSLSNEGRYPVRLSAPASLEWKRGRLSLGRFDAQLAEGGISIRSLRWENKRIDSEGGFTRFPAAWLIFAAGFSNELKGDLLLNGQWNLVANPRVNGTLSVSRASGDLIVQSAPPIALGLRTLQSDARFTQDRLDLRAQVDAKVLRADAELRVLPVGAPGAEALGRNSPMNLSANVDVATLGPLSALFATRGRVDGSLQADLRAGGTLAQPALRGNFKGDRLSVDVPPYGIYLNEGRLRARLEKEVLHVDEFAIRGGDGTFTATGSMPLYFAEGGARLDWKAERFALLNRPDMRLTLSGSGRGDFDGKKIALRGELRADSGYFEFGDDELPRLSDDVVIVGRKRQPRDRVQARTPFELDMRLDLGRGVEINGYGLTGRLLGDVQLSSTAEGELRAAGRIRTQDARFLAYGQRLDVEQGLLIFDGPLDNPALSIQAWRRNQAVEVGVEVAGTVQKPTAQLVSEPPVPEGEKLSWLVLGRAPNDAQGADLALLQAAAGTLFGRGDKVGINQQIARKLGLDDVSVRGSGQLTGNVVALGKRFSDKLYVSYEQGLGIAQNLVRLDYSISRRWSARLETGTSSALGLVYRFAFD